jgi:hypothetical protein
MLQLLLVYRQWRAQKFDNGYSKLKNIEKKNTAEISEYVLVVDPMSSCYHALVLTNNTSERSCHDMHGISKKTD